MQHILIQILIFARSSGISKVTDLLAVYSFVEEGLQVWNWLKFPAKILFLKSTSGMENKLS